MDREFLNGWYAAEHDDYIGIGERKEFPTYRTNQFIMGYKSFWDNQDFEIESAENSCIGEYDMNKGF